MKTSEDYLAAANDVVPSVEFEDALAKHTAGNTLFVDVRDSAAIEKTGTIAGAKRLPRGFLEFASDDQSPYHDPDMKKDADIVLICGAGGQAALAGKTLKEMGFQSVANAGGFPAWKEKGGPSED